MKKLIIAFLKIFFRNSRAMFFTIFLPAVIFSVLAFLGIQGVIRFDLPVTYNNFLLSGIIAMAIMQTGIYTVAYSMIDYRRTLILKRLAITPLSAFEFLFAEVVARFLIACVQVAILLIVGALIFHTTTHGLWVLPILIFLGSTVFLNFGFLIAAVARDYEEAAPYTTILGLSFLFLGDVFFPVKNLPAILVQIANYLPLKPLSASIRYFLLGVQTPDLGRDLFVLTAWLIVLSLVSQYIFQKRVYK